MRTPFPTRFYCADNYGWAECPPLAKMVWQRLRRSLGSKLIWYGVDMEVVSPTSINLFVYEIADNFSGGIGKRIFETVVTEFTSEEKTLLDKVVLGIYTSHAEDELQRREDEERMKKILAVRMEMFGV